MLKIFLVLTVLCAVIAKSKSDHRPYGPPPYSRYKRIRYSGPPHKFHRPHSHGFTHAPPPRYTEEEPKYTETFNTATVKKPNENLEEDLQSFVKQLSSQDLDKILEYAGQNRDNERYNKESNEKHNYQTEEFKTTYNTLQETEYPPKVINEIGSDVGVIDFDNTFLQDLGNDNYINDINYMTESTPFNVYNQNQEQTFYNSPQENIQHTHENVQSFNHNNNEEQDDVLFSGIKDMPEIDLPLPINLREVRDDFEVADTKNTPAVALPSYQVEDFGSLPLMNYHSKKDTLSSYHVPHYTVTSKSTYSAPPPSSYTPSYKPSYGNIPVEPAPPKSAAKYQSDAHQKAVKIWATRSKGWAYTLNDDGSLTQERYGRPKYGHRR